VRVLETILAALMLPVWAVLILNADVVLPFMKKMITKLKLWWKQSRCSHQKQNMWQIQFDGTRVHECEDCGKQWSICHESRYHATGR
jgi:hypothetical protein